MSEYHKHADPWDYEPEFAKHMGAMTAEDLHNKADIALEFAIRDRRISELERQLFDLGRREAQLLDQHAFVTDQIERMKPVVEAAKLLCVTVPIPPNGITWELGVDILNKVQDILCPRVREYQKEE